MNQNNKTDLFNPLYWGIGVFFLGIILMLCGYFIFPNDQNFPWLVTSALLLIFAIFTNVFNIKTTDFTVYVRKGVISFAALFLSFKYLATFFSGLSISDAKAYRTIYFVIIIAYITIMAICVFVRTILQKIKERDEKEHGI